jgi:SAM-dependent methyltransferase
MQSHDAQVNQQFGPRAAAYLTSAVHAQGADLTRIAQCLEGRDDARVLDLGFAIAPHVRSVTACDLSPQMLAVVTEAATQRGLNNITTRECAAEHLPFVDASVDAVCTRFSAHHWADVPRAMAEAHRVLVPGGRLFVIDIFAPSVPLLDTHLQTVELLRDVSHGRDYSLAEWHAHLSNAGFRLDHHDTWKLRMAFDTWIARMQTPADRAAVIRDLLLNAPEEVRAHFEVEPDGSFKIDAVSLEATRVGT